MTNNRTTKANVDPKPAPTTETKPMPTAETKPMPTTETKPAPAAETKPVPAAETKPVPAVIVFGVDQANRRIAASFPADQVELATKAAGLMRLRVLKVAAAELIELADQLPVGRIYASGQAFVPPIRPRLYDWLTDLADPKPAPGLPGNWDDINVGHLVIAHESPSAGWYEAIVVARNNDMLTIKWRDYPKDPPLVRHITAVALLKPTVVNA
jgi:hypothetical protein